MRKSLIWFPMLMVICVLIGMFACQGAWARPVENNIRISIEGGFDGVAKLGAWAPLHISVVSPAEDFSGELQVEAHLDQTRTTIVAKPVALKAGIEQELYFEVPVVTAKKGIDIRLVEKKKVIAEQTFEFKRLLPPEAMMIGVLSEDPDAYSWLGGNTIPVVDNVAVDEKMKLMIAAGEISTAAAREKLSNDEKYTYKKYEAVVVPLDRNTLPENSEVMDGFDFLVISNFDTGLCGEQQVETLEKWVDTGGTLLMGTGLNWQKVYHGLPDSLKPFAIQGTRDVDAAQILETFTQRDVPKMNLKLAEGEIGFEFVPPSQEGTIVNEGTPSRFFDNDIIAGNEENPIVIKYRKGIGNIFVFTFEPAIDPFLSWQAKGTFIDYVLRCLNSRYERFREYRNGFFQKRYSNSFPMQGLAGDVPSDKRPPFTKMFLSLAVYVVLVGPALYLTLKKFDRRDWAWVLIPTISVVFLLGMYLLGFKSRYHSAVTNTVSLIQAITETDSASVSSAVGVFNDRRGTLMIAYDEENGIRPPYTQNNDYYSYGYSEDIEGKLVSKYTIADQIIYEQYDVMLWTPLLLYANKTIPFDSSLIKSIYFEDGSLKGTIQNTTPFDLMDAVVIIGTNIIPIGDILSGDTQHVDIPMQGDRIYKRTEDYLDGEFGRTYYDNVKDYPADYQEMMRKRNIFENSIRQLFNNFQGRTRFVLLAQNDQIIDYGLVVNEKEPQKYNQNLIWVESSFEFQPGQEVEIPGGIIWPSYLQNKDVGWQEDLTGIRIHDTGDMEFVFQLPENLDVTEMQLSVESYLPLRIQYNMNQNANIEILTNQYAYSLYNVTTQNWDTIESNTTLSENPERYIGEGNEVRMKITVVALGQPDEKEESDRDVYREYQNEMLSMPEIRVRGVAK